MKHLFSLSLCFFLILSAAKAQEPGYYEESRGGNHHHHAGFFLGAADGLAAHGTTDFSFGMDYEYIFGQTKPGFGTGVFFEIVFADHKEYIIGLPIFVHPIDGLKFWIAPSVIIPESSASTPSGETAHLILKEEKGDKALSAEGEASPASKFMLRIGAAYDFHVGAFTISPTLCFDQTKGCSFLVYGLAFGFGF